ncbi:tyrosine/serine protein phosphatase-like protein [Amylocarpus encephaloides]|uniref:Tyrosine/serine protein phosphatase-like protein n=1 Tax=Amylocarpus encephaloides TaxID=45428 RepID=A0A9P7YI02_9HELO|nr:tyrosine/serine protein phosphatase-like protein [Amylocarpus encephaloides]
MADVREGEILVEKFENILNFRDVGSTINKFTGKKLVTEGLLFRSARPDDATLLDRKRLVEQFGIKTIVDLRTVTEHANQVKKRQGQLKMPQIVQSNETLSKPLKIPDVNYRLININGKSFERSLIHRLSWWSLIKIAFLMLFRQRMKAIAIMCREVMGPRGLVGLGKDTIDNSGPEILETLHALSNRANAPVLVHCTQGKDRTGLVICLALLLLGVPVDAIVHDYLLSEEELVPEYESRLEEIRSIGLGEEFAGCPADWVQEMVSHLDIKHGGARGYAKSIGFQELDQEALVERMACVS